MPPGTPCVLLVSEDTQERDAYAAVLRDHGVDIKTADDEAGTRVLLQREPLSSILVLSSATQSACRELLRVRSLHCPNVPVFFTRPANPASIEAILASTGITILPQTPQAADIEAVVEADTAQFSTHGSPQKHRLASLWLPKAEYPLVFRDARAKFEAEFLIRVLRKYRGNVSKASRAINLARRNVQLKCKQYGIDMSAFRDEPDDY